MKVFFLLSWSSNFQDFISCVPGGDACIGIEHTELMLKGLQFEDANPLDNTLTIYGMKCPRK